MKVKYVNNKEREKQWIKLLKNFEKDPGNPGLHFSHTFNLDGNTQA